MSQEIPIERKINLEDSQDQNQSVPSSFSVDPEYFNSRLVRIKKKIDDLIKNCI